MAKPLIHIVKTKSGRYWQSEQPIRNEIEAVTKSLPSKRNLEPDVSTIASVISKSKTKTKSKI